LPYKSHQSDAGTILVADDQAANRELLEQLLTTQGFRVITVCDGGRICIFDQFERLVRTGAADFFLAVRGWRLDLGEKTIGIRNFLQRR
jgi:DNA-binding response OmpR family regulator